MSTWQKEIGTDILKEVNLGSQSYNDKPTGIYIGLENNETHAINEIYDGDITIVDVDGNPLTSTWIVPRLDTPVDDTARQLLISCEENSGIARNQIIKFKYNGNAIAGKVNITQDAAYRYWHDRLYKDTDVDYSEFVPYGEITLAIKPYPMMNYISNWQISRDGGKNFSTSNMSPLNPITSGTVEFQFYNYYKQSVGSSFSIDSGVDGFKMELCIYDVWNHDGYLDLTIPNGVFNKHSKGTTITTGNSFTGDIKYVKVRLSKSEAYTASHDHQENSTSDKKYSNEWAWSDFIEVSN